MQSNIPLKFSLIIIGISTILFSSIVIFFAENDETLQSLFQGMSVKSSQDGSKSFSSEKSNVGTPVRLKIPAIHVDAALEYVGLTKAGAMDVPKGPENPAWFKLGPRPGEEGSAVIAGHYGWKDGIPAVFDRLNQLKKGDKIYVEDANGSTTTFVVRESLSYGENQDASLVFGSTDGKVHLNLITCEGTWNKTQQSYSRRLIVFTDKE